MSLFVLLPQVTTFYPSIRYLAFGVSDLLAEFGGLMGLLAGISVFSIAEIFCNILKSFWFTACKSKIAPQTVRRRRRRILVNRDHLFYRLGQTFLDLLKQSNVHGVHYTSDEKLKVIERVFWFITIVVLLAFSSVMVFGSLKNLQLNSVVVAIDEKIWSVEDVRLKAL